MYQFHYYNAANLLYVQFKGEIDHVEIIQMLQRIIDNKKLPGELKLLTDYREAIVYDDDSQNVLKIRDYAIEHLPARFSELWWANVSPSPKLAVGAALFAQGISEVGVRYEIFSSIKGALVGLHFTNEELEHLHQKGIN